MDVSREEIIQKANEIIDNGGDAYIKWTCPGCGDRCISDIPNTFNLGGYTHDKCGTTYTGELFGLLAIFSSYPSSPRSSVDRAGDF